MKAGNRRLPGGAPFRLTIPVYAWAAGYGEQRIAARSAAPTLAELDVSESPMPDDGGRWNLCAWCHGHAGVGVSLGHLGDL